MGQAVLQVSPKSGSARGSCSTVSKNRTRGRLPFSVRMNRSAQPLPSGALTRAGELPAPRNASSSWKTADMHWPPWSWRTRSPAAAPLAKVPERWRTPLAERRERLEAGAVSGGVDADALGAVVARGDEHRDLAFPGPGGGHADAPRHVQDGGNDGAAVVARSAGCADPRGCRQGVLAQQPEHRVAPALPRRPATPTTTRRLCPPRKRSQSCPRNLGTRADSASPLNGRPSSSNTWPVPIARLNDAAPRPGRVDSRLRAAWPTGVAPSSPMLAAEGVSTASRRAGGCHEPRSDSLSQAGEQNPSFSEEKEAKRLCPLGLRRSGGSGDQWAKVLWFFLSRKNSLLSQGGEQCRGWQVHDRRWMAARLLVVPGSMPMIMPRSTRTGRSGQGTRVAPRQPGRASAPAFPMGLPRRRVCGRQQESRDPGARPGGP